MSKFNVRKLVLPNPMDLTKGKPMDRFSIKSNQAAPWYKKPKKAPRAKAPKPDPGYRMRHVSQSNSNVQPISSETLG